VRDEIKETILTDLKEFVRVSGECVWAQDEEAVLFFEKVRNNYTIITTNKVTEK